MLTVLSGYDAISNYLIGDPAYPLTSYCIKEFTSCSKNEEVIFNNMLRSCFIYSCFVLHNFCESLSDNHFDEAEIHVPIVRHQQEDDEPDPVYSRNDSAGEYVCHVLTEYISQNLPDGY